MRINGTPPRPIAGFQSVSDAARAWGCTRQDAKRRIRDMQRKEQDQRRLEREIASWDDMVLNE